MGDEMVITFPGNLKVHAQTGSFTVETDQPPKSGGDDTAPSPFTLFAASIATCAGYFALKFCRTRSLDTKGMSLTLGYGWDKEKKKYPQMIIKLHLPDDFPEKYKDAIIRAMDQCVVKKHILDPPEFDIEVV